jgi:hypothetical protein
MTVAAVTVPSITKEETIRTHVSLSEFKPEEVAEWLRGEGYQVDGTFRKVLKNDALVSIKRHSRSCTCDCDCDYESGLLIDEAQLSRIGTLLLCGQRDAAREHALALVGDAIGKAL